MINLPIFVVVCERIPKRMWYYIKFSPNNQLLDRIRELPEDTRKYNQYKICWEISAYSLFLLIKKYKGSNKIHFDFGNPDSKKIFINQIKKVEDKEIAKRKYIEELNIKKEQWVEYKKELEETYLKYVDVVQESLKDGVVLYPHQVISVMYLNAVKNALLALDMGTGKSIISIAYSEMNAFKKVFVLTPNSLKYNYYNEIKKFTNSNAYIIGKKNDCTIEDAKYIITNYEYFSSSDTGKVLKKFNDLKIGKLDCLIVDECHRLKSSKSNSFINFKKIFKDELFVDNKPSKIFMSGTPAPSRATELYTVLNQISPHDFTSKTKYYQYYCGMEYDFQNGWGWTKGTEMTRFEELFHKIAPFTYRKTKAEVLKDLPEKTYQKVLLDMSDKEYQIYYDLESGVANEFVNQQLTNPLTIMGKLREYTSNMKVNNVSELIDSIIETGEKFVVIDFYKDSLKQLHKKYPSISALHTGDEKDYERSEVVNKFQDENSDLKIFLGSEATTKEGLTLTAASKVGMLTIPWTPGTLDQCTDRLARIGQKNAVNAYVFIYKDTIDEYIFDLIESKRAEISQVIDGKQYDSNVDQSIINDLIKKIKSKHGL